MKEIVYIETTIPSFYFDERPDCIRRRKLTREWWDTQRKHFECYTSSFTLLETQKTEYPNKDEVVALVNELDFLAYTEYADEINEIIEVYIKNFVMPAGETGDAAHLAIASFHSVDYLLTWNCKHLANAFKYAHIQKINLKLGLITPMIITPEQLYKEDFDNGR